MALMWHIGAEDIEWEISLQICLRQSIWLLIWSSLFTYVKAYLKHLLIAFARLNRIVDVSRPLHLHHIHKLDGSLASSSVDLRRLHRHPRYITLFRTFGDFSNMKIVILADQRFYEVFLKFYKTLFISTLFICLIRRLVKHLHMLTSETRWKNFSSRAGMVITFMFGNFLLIFWEKLTDAGQIILFTRQNKAIFLD